MRTNTSPVPRALGVSFESNARSTHTYSTRVFIARECNKDSALEEPQLTVPVRCAGLVGKGGGGALRLREAILKEGRVLPNRILDVSKFMDSTVGRCSESKIGALICLLEINWFG